MNQYPTHLQTLIASFKKLPGVGRKTAERFAFYLLDWSDHEIKKFSTHISTLKEKIQSCPICGCLQEKNACTFCTPNQRDSSLLCLVSSPKDVYAIEETKAFKGLYHVIGGLLSPLDGRSIEKFDLHRLEKRLENFKIEEVILAFDSTLEGDATALFFKQKLSKLHVKATRLAFGLPMGSCLDFVDYGTLEKAFHGRRDF